MVFSLKDINKCPSCDQYTLERYLHVDNLELGVDRVQVPGIVMVEGCWSCGQAFTGPQATDDRASRVMEWVAKHGQPN